MNDSIINDAMLILMLLIELILQMLLCSNIVDSHVMFIDPFLYIYKNR